MSLVNGINAGICVLSLGKHILKGNARVMIHNKRSMF
jgi:hypothetical protein